MIENLQGALFGTATIFLFLAAGLLGAVLWANDYNKHGATKILSVLAIVIFVLSVTGYISQIWIGVFK